MNTLQHEISMAFPHLPPRNSQLPVYKFVSRRWLAGFFDSGSVRVGTLHDFRKIEAHGKSRGDAFEGKSNVVQHVPFADRIEKDTFLSTFFAPGSAAQFTNSTFFEKRDFPNSFVFCTSSHFSDDLLLRWHEEEKVDACYEIFDWQGYHAEITMKLAPMADSLGAQYVRYVTGDINGESEQRHILAPFIKKQEYDWQSEFRGVWIHKSPSIDVKAACIEIPDARKYCRPFATLDAGKIQRI